MSIETPVFANVGCGARGSAPIPGCFTGWRELRVDSDAVVQPDIIGDLTDLSALKSESVDALYASHCVEHLYLHQVPVALAEFCRVLKPQGFALIVVPDLQVVASYVAADRLHETLYQSPAGPITPHDVLFGYGAAIAAGRVSMAHRCGFTPGMLSQQFSQSAFPVASVHRRAQSLELVAIGRKIPAPEDRQAALLAALGL